MPLIKDNLQNFEIVNNVVKLTTQYLKNKSYRFKKITGSRLASVLGVSKYDSPFKAWMIITNLYKDIFDPTLATVGNTIEPIIRDYVIKILKHSYKAYEPAKINWDVFSNNNIFGGIPDGEPINENGEIDYSSSKPMLEIKTTSIDSFVYKTQNNQLTMQKDGKGYPLVKQVKSKYNSWFINNQIQISNEYAMQLGLYLYLRNINYGVFAIGFLETVDYVLPHKFNPNQREIKLVDFYIDRNKFQVYIDYATKWYNNYIITGVSPMMTENDKKWLKTELAIYGK